MNLLFTKVRNEFKFLLTLPSPAGEGKVCFALNSYNKELFYCGAFPEVQADNRFAASSAQWLTAFSASPHCH